MCLKSFIRLIRLWQGCNCPRGGGALPGGVFRGRGVVRGRGCSPGGGVFSFSVVRAGVVVRVVGVAVFLNLLCVLATRVITRNLISLKNILRLSPR